MVHQGRQDGHNNSHTCEPDQVEVVVHYTSQQGAGTCKDWVRDVSLQQDWVQDVSLQQD